MSDSKNGLNLTSEQKLINAVNTIKQLFTKYNVGDFNQEELTSLITDMYHQGANWYSAYCELSRFSDNDQMYRRNEYFSLSDSVESADNAMVKLETNENFINFMVKSKMLINDIELYGSQYVKEMFELSSKLSECETEKESIVQSYLDAGISSIIIDHFVKHQNPNYSDLVKKSKSLETRINFIGREQDKQREDISSLKDAINCIESETKLIYIDPDDDNNYYRYSYNKAIQTSMENMQANKQKPSLKKK